MRKPSLCLALVFVPLLGCHTGTASGGDVDGAVGGDDGGGGRADAARATPDATGGGGVDAGCVPTTTATDESGLCNGIDDNCNGMIDEGAAPGINAPCDVGMGICKTTGYTICTSDGKNLACYGTPLPVATAEMCNNLDDNCNGQVDEGNPEGGQACDTGLMGVCKAGTTRCDTSVVGQDKVVCDQNVQPSAEVCGDNLDNDCDGTVDNGCPSQVALRWPPDGYDTGSIYATAPGRHARRPHFVWEPVSGATSYDFEIDDSCTTPGFDTCTFASAVKASPTTNTYDPLNNLQVDTLTPVGRRWYWHVRACNTVGCGPWSAVRYLDVGRLRDDVNGDGYSDVLVGLTDAADLYVPSSGTLPAGPASPALADGTNKGFGFGQLVVPLGDVNGDGYADAAIAELPKRRVFIYFGSDSGLIDGDKQEIDSPGMTGDGFATSVAGVGDVNGDGYADVFIGAPTATISSRPNIGYAYVYYGSATGLQTTGYTTLSDPNVGSWCSYNGVVPCYFGQLATGMDFNGDGYSDVAIAATGDGMSGYGGVVYVYNGGSTGLATTALQMSPQNYHNAQGAALAADDLNGDGYGDLLIGCAPGYPSTPFVDEWNGSKTGIAYSGGSATTFYESNCYTLGGNSVDCGLGLAVGDLNGDGTPDVIMGAFKSKNGAVYAHVSNGTGGRVDWTFTPTTSLTSGGEYGYSVAAGDVNGDGNYDLVIGAPGMTTAQIYMGGSTTTQPTTNTVYTGGSAFGISLF